MDKETKFEEAREREDLIQTVCENIYEAMCETEMSAARLSEITGVPVRSIQRYMRGDAMPRLDYLYVIAHAMGRTVGQLVDDE